MPDDFSQPFACDVDDPRAEAGDLPGNLRGALTPLLGREAALAELVAALWETRLLVLCGPGGVGKSRLALALAEAVRGDLIGGAWWVDLSTSADAAHVERAVVAAILPSASASDPLTTVARELSQPALIVLDNAEQASAACASVVVELLARAPQLRIVATSRQSLGVVGERVWRVPGLDHAPRPVSAQPAGEPAAVMLFTQRAGEASATFSPTGAGTRQAVSQICRWLDGNPLAIELAAARVPVLDVAEIARRLHDDVGFLRHSRRAAPQRHRALEDTLEWSHRLLDDDERILFRRLGAFRGGFSLPAAETVCGDERLPAAGVLDLVGQLVDRSLADVVEAAGPPRFRLPPTVRQFARAKLDEARETAAVQERHAGFFSVLARRGALEPTRIAELAYAEALELDHDNLRDAVQWLSEHAAQRAAELSLALWPFCYRRGHYDEARGWLERALATGDRLPEPLLVEVLLTAGDVCFMQCDYPVATAHLDRARERIDPADQPRLAARVRHRLGSIAREQARYPEARRLHTESGALWRAAGDPEGPPASESYLAFAAWLSGDFAAARTLAASALATFREQANLPEIVVALLSLGAAAGYRGDLDAAVVHLDEALGISRRLGFQEGIAWSLHELAIAGRRRRGLIAERESMLRDALLIHHRLGDRWRVASVLEEIAGSALARSDDAVAAWLLGAADRVREEIGAPVPPAEVPDRDAAVRRLQRRLGESGLAAGRRQGREGTLDDAVTAAVDAIDRLGRAPGGDSRRTAPVLTSREMGVLELLGQGATNREIAEALYISTSTAGVHVSNILRKLDAKRRVDAAARAQALGLLDVAVAAGG